MKHIFKFFVALFLMCFVQVFAQKDTLVDKDYSQLTQLIINSKNDTTIAVAITKYYLAKAEREQQLERQWEGIQTLALIYHEARDFYKSEKYVDQLISFVALNNLESYRYQTQIAAGYFSMREGTFLNALDFFNNALKIAEQDDDIEKIQRAYYFLNLIQATGGDYKAAIDTQHKLLAKIQSLDTTKLSRDKKEQLFFMAHASISDSYLKAKNADSAYYYSKIALDLGLEKQDSCTIKMLYWQLGLSEVYKEKYEDALQTVEEAKKYCQPPTRIDNLIIGGISGKIYLGKKQYKRAIAALENGINAYDVPNSEEGFMDDLYFNLATAYKEDGDIEKAGYYLSKHINTQNKFSLIKDTINTSFREREVAEFKKELTLLEIEKEQNKSYLNYFLLGSTVIILTLLFFLLKFYKNKKADEAKFEALITKINAAKSPSEIIDTKDAVLEEKATNDVSEEVTQQILDGLKKLEDKEYFLKQDCSSYNVAKKINTNTSYLSKVINSHYGKNFNTYINDLRINYAIVRLKNDVFFRSFSIQAIAEEVGYKSADSFTKYFKKDTGLNPSFYIKNIKNVA